MSEQVMGEVELQPTCPRHWQELREAIDALGLGHLVAKDKADADLRMRRRLPSDFEPLLYAWETIMRNGLEACGVTTECFCCINEKHIATCTNPKCATREGYITLAAKDALRAARQFGLVPTAN